MIYNQYPYNTFNQDYLQNIINQQEVIHKQMMQEMHDAEQKANIEKMVKAIHDYCDAARKVTPDYKQLALYISLEKVIIEAEKDKGI